MGIWTTYLLVLSNFIIATTVVGAATHRITWEEGFDCQAWASNQKFIVGDNLIFFSNNAADQNSVMNVNHIDYKSCSPSSPYATYRTGNNLVTIDQQDLHFISSVREYCKSGLKLHVHASLVTTTSPASTHRASSVASSLLLFCIRVVLYVYYV